MQHLPLLMLFTATAIGGAAAAVTVQSNIIKPPRVGYTSDRSRLRKLLLSSTEGKSHFVRDDGGVPPRDASFLAQYSLLYTGCSPVLSSTENDSSNRDEWFGKYRNTPHLAHFSLCPTNGTTGSSCSASCANNDNDEYVTPLGVFIDAYTEYKLETKEYFCEIIRETCDCSDKNDTVACESQCYRDVQLQGCETRQSSNELLNSQRYMECQKAIPSNKTTHNDGMQHNNQSYYIGPYCNMTDMYSIHLGIFDDANCTNHVENSSTIYRNELGYGIDLPFSSKSLVDSEEDCVECRQADQNINFATICDDEINKLEVADVCEEIYRFAAATFTREPNLLNNTSNVSSPPDNIPSLSQPTTSNTTTQQNDVNNNNSPTSTVTTQAKSSTTAPQLSLLLWVVIGVIIVAVCIAVPLAIGMYLRLYHKSTRNVVLAH